jgi:hypothetical protein
MVVSAELTSKICGVAAAEPVGYRAATLSKLAVFPSAENSDLQEILMQSFSLLGERDFGENE